MSPATREPPPEAQLIKRYREALGISPETATERLKIKMSARRWRHIEAGEETKGGPEVHAGNGQLAHMSYVVGVTPEQLEELDKAEAAAILRVIKEREGAALDADIRTEVAEITTELHELASLYGEFGSKLDQLERRAERVLGELEHGGAAETG